jgi:hypothetical protein
MRSKIPELEKALTGLVQPHHRFLLSRQLAHIDFLDEQVEELSVEIARQVEATSNPSPPGGQRAMQRRERSLHLLRRRNGL